MDKDSYDFDISHIMRNHFHNLTLIKCRKFRNKRKND